ncbi:unnamed protein product [Strongylus vulgaris]|uniref:G-protein coupled receptors family 1 profile domain-containing protein n=1 Tax=Strongylus vulgaris TaxID=40348 RepID=A0A3P7IXQ3_STRVU|nr:unnamed protein product [Strongylus vulgaris]
MIADAPPIIFVIFHWLIPLLEAAPILTSFTATYPPALNTVLLPDDVLARANLISVITVVIWFIVCALCYIPVLLQLLRSNVLVNRKKRNEVRLSIQVVGLMIAFLLVFVYHIGQYIMLQSSPVSLRMEQFW